MESKLPGFTGEKEKKPMLAILQEGEWPCPAAEEHFQEQTGRRGGGSSGKVCVTSLFCEFYPSLDQEESRF